MSHLFSPITIGNLSLTNRIVIAPMCQFAAENGIVSDWHTIHYGNLSHSGAGILIFEATAVNPVGRISPYCLGLWDETTEASMKGLVDQITPYSTMPFGVQLAHAGRKASSGSSGQMKIGEGGWQTVAPSQIPYTEGDVIPTEMSLDDIKTFIAEFAESAKRALRCGFDLIEIHAAHGYLLHQFLSPLTNKRTDEYGGSLENRMRLVIDIYKAVKDAVPEMKSIGVRISATDWVEGGWDVEQSIELAKQLDVLGCDFLHVSSGGLSEAQKIAVGPGYQVGFASEIKSEVQMPVIAVGLITEAEQAETILATGQADMIGVARTILYDPRWPWHAAAKLGDKVKAPPRYHRCAPRSDSKLFE